MSHFFVVTIPFMVKVDKETFDVYEVFDPNLNKKKQKAHDDEVEELENRVKELESLNKEIENTSTRKTSTSTNKNSGSRKREISISKNNKQTNKQTNQQTNKPANQLTNKQSSTKASTTNANTHTSHKIDLSSPSAGIIAVKNNQLMRAPTQVCMYVCTYSSSYICIL